MSKRKKKRYDYEIEYRAFPALYAYDPRFFPGGAPGFPGHQPFPGGTPVPGGLPLPPGQQPGVIPPFGGPGGFPGGPGGVPGGPGGPGGPGAPGGAPTTPPPNYIPQKGQSFTGGPQGYAVSAPSLQPCLFRFVYVWLQNGNSFWFYPVYLDRRTVTGYRWNGFSWAYTGLDLRRIDYFTCT